MLINFYKYQGAGNDFILIDNREKMLSYSQKLTKKLCSRHTGIGSDGLILLENSANSDFKMIFYNPDGSKGMMCGNGGRCIVKFAQDLKIITNKTQFEAPDGLHTAEINNKIVNLSMRDIRRPNASEKENVFDTGAPHYIIFTEDVDKINVRAEGKKIRYNSEYLHLGINVDFVQTMQNYLKIRTYERGVEDETLACGTGIVAAAIASYQKGLLNSNSVVVKARGGELRVDFKVNPNFFTDVVLCGAAKQVFKGTYELLTDN